MSRRTTDQVADLEALSVTRIDDATQGRPPLEPDVLELFARNCVRTTRGPDGSPQGKPTDCRAGDLTFGRRRIQAIAEERRPGCRFERPEVEHRAPSVDVDRAVA